MTTLADEIKAFQTNFLPKVPKDAMKAILSTTEDLVKSGIATKGLQKGDRFPNFSLPNAQGQEVSLQNLLKDGPAIINFYRGSWCPYCNFELKAYQDRLEQIKQLGGQLIAITPQQPDNSLFDIEKHALQFEVLSDLGNKLSQEIGIAFSLDEKLKPIYTEFGFSLSDYNGDDDWVLPIPATYIIDTEQTIRHAYIDADYTTRAEPDSVVEALKNL